jgi:predicted nucleic acid-binding protein
MPKKTSTRTLAMPIAVSNSSPLIHLSMVGHIGLLRRFSSSCIFNAIASDL